MTGTGPDVARTGSKGRWAWGLLAYSLLMTASPHACAQDISVPADLQAKFLLKTLTFDRQFRTKSPNVLLVGVLIQRKYRPSLLAAEEFRDALLSLKGASDSQIRVILLDPEVDGSVSDMLKRYRPDILYVPPLRAIPLQEVTAACRSEQVHSFTAVPEYVLAGVSLGLDTRGDRPVILVNLPASRAEGADFTSKLLRFAQTVE